MTLFKGRGQKTSMFCQGHVVEKPYVSTCATLKKNWQGGVLLVLLGFILIVFSQQRGPKPNKARYGPRSERHGLLHACARA